MFDKMLNLNSSLQISCRLPLFPSHCLPRSSSSLTDCEERPVSISWETPPVSLCVRLSAEEESFRRPLTGLTGLKPGNQTNDDHSHQANGFRYSGTEIRALLHSVVSGIFRQKLRGKKSALKCLHCAQFYFIH